MRRWKSWYPGKGWEIGFDLRMWALGGYYRTGEFAVFFGPIMICYDRSLVPW
jgi:hypothetical protein